MFQGRQLVWATFALGLPLGSCAISGPVANTAVCPPVQAYAAETLTRAYVEYSMLPVDSGLRRLVDDYMLERIKLRACRDTSGDTSHD